MDEIELLYSSWTMDQDQDLHRYILFKNARHLGDGKSSVMWKKMETLL